MRATKRITSLALRGTLLGSLAIAPMMLGSAPAQAGDWGVQIRVGDRGVRGGSVWYDDNRRGHRRFIVPERIHRHQRHRFERFEVGRVLYADYGPARLYRFPVRTRHGVRLVPHLYQRGFLIASGNRIFRDIVRRPGRGFLARNIVIDICRDDTYWASSRPRYGHDYRKGDIVYDDRDWHADDWRRDDRRRRDVRIDVRSKPGKGKDKKWKERKRRHYWDDDDED